MGEALLARVEINGRDPLPDIQQGYGDMHRGGRFARAAFLVAKHDNVCGRGPSRVRLNQHQRHLTRGNSYPRTARNQGFRRRGWFND